MCVCGVGHMAQLGKKNFKHVQKFKEGVGQESQER